MQLGQLKRRNFISLLGSAAAWPLVARAQRPVAQPLIGFLSTRSPEEAAIHTNAFRRGLEEMGYVEGRSVAVEYRWAKGDYSRLPPFVADLLSRPLSVMVAAGDPAAHAAKTAGVAVPLVFIVGGDPVRAGLVASMNRRGMATGVNFFTGDLGGKRLELLCAMVPSAHLVGLLLNPSFGIEAVDQQRRGVATAARTLGRELVVQEASTDAEIEAGFAALVKAGVTALVVQNDPFFDSRRSQIVALSSRQRLAGIFHIREFPADGGLMSYGVLQQPSRKNPVIGLIEQTSSRSPSTLRGVLGRPPPLPLSSLSIAVSACGVVDRLLIFGEPHLPLPTRAITGKSCCSHSISSSASMRMGCGTARPSAFAVCMLMTSSNFVGRSTGRSSGLAAAGFRELEKRCGHDGADRVATDVLPPSVERSLDAGIMDDRVHVPDCVDLFRDPPGLRGPAQIPHDNPGGTRGEG